MSLQLSDGDPVGLGPDTRLSARPTMRDVAALAGVSLSAVSLVVNGKPGVGPRKRERILAAMDRLGYTTDSRRNSATETKLLGLLMESLSVPGRDDGFYTRVIGGIEEAAYRLGYRLLLHLYRPDADSIGDIAELMGREMAGMIIANDGDVTVEAIRKIVAMGRPVVLVENYLPDPLHAVTADNFSAGLMMTNHLIELGHRRIGALRGPDKYSSLRDRFRGHETALLEHGIAIEHELQPPPVSGHPKKGYLQMQQLLALSSPPTAVFAVSDKSAFGAMEAVKEAGLRIPEDISIVGIDDVAESVYSSPPLTTYRVPKRKLGEVAVGIMHTLLTSDVPPARTLLIGHFVERNSSAPPGSMG
ncbi:MAG TPA: LacI family DNA-binding transcriptional regulator [Herpetosiphonaceae bacterium]|nr:LacI family DNA-binding transcriptional regulator [Herpetosiphonaceae bacterium]